MHRICLGRIQIIIIIFFFFIPQLTIIYYTIPAELHWYYFGETRVDNILLNTRHTCVYTYIYIICVRAARHETTVILQFQRKK